MFEALLIASVNCEAALLKYDHFYHTLSVEVAQTRDELYSGLSAEYNMERLLADRAYTTVFERANSRLENEFEGLKEVCGSELQLGLSAYGLYQKGLRDSPSVPRSLPLYQINWIKRADS